MRDKVVCERWGVAKKDGAQRPTRPSIALLHEATERHPCHGKPRRMSPSATPGGCCQVPRLPRKVTRRPGRPKRAQARHQSQPSAPSATPATRNEGGCHQVPRLPRKVAPPSGVTEMVCERWCVCVTKRRTKVDVAKCHTCHAKWRRQVPCLPQSCDKNGV